MKNRGLSVFLACMIITSMLLIALPVHADNNADEKAQMFAAINVTEVITTQAEITTVLEQTTEHITEITTLQTTEAATELTTEPPTEPETREYLYGDVFLDNYINIADALFLQKHVAKMVQLTQVQATAADVDNSKAIDINDVLIIRKHIAKLINSFPAGVTFTSEATEKMWYEAIYDYISHEAETIKEWVVDKAGYTYEIPTYEYKERAICSACGQDITDLGDSGIGEHLKEHMLKGENGSWYSEFRKVQTDVEIITVVEEGHWEERVVKEAWTEEVLVRAAGYY